MDFFWFNGLKFSCVMQGFGRERLPTCHFGKIRFLVVGPMAQVPSTMPGVWGSPFKHPLPISQKKKKIAERKKEYIERALASHCEQLGMPIHENEMCPISVSFMKQWYLLYFHINPWVWGHIRDSIQKTDDIEIKKSAIWLHLIYAVLITPSFGSNYLAKIL